MSGSRRKSGTRVPEFLLAAVVMTGAAFLAAACSGAGTDLPGKIVFERTCGQCHPLERPLSKHKDLEGWRRTVAVMRARGAKLTDVEAEWVVEYLHAIRPEK